MNTLETSMDAVLTEERFLIRSGATVEEYMDFENNTEERHEFHNGDILTMPGVHHRHAIIVANLLIFLGSQLRGRGRIYSEMLKLNIPAFKRIVYPDVMITLGDEEFVENDSMRLVNPTVVIEVLSESTARYDKTDKFEYYRSLPSVQEIVFVAQHRRSVELYRRQNGGWMLFDITDETDPATLHLLSVEASITLDDLYA